MIYLPHVRSEDPPYKKFGIYLFNWIFWIIPAATATFSRDVGPYYRDEAALFTTIASALIIVALVAPNEALGITIPMVAIGAGIAYLVLGIFYHLAMRKWG